MEDYDKKAEKRARVIDSRIQVEMKKVNSFLNKYGESLPSKISAEIAEAGQGPVRIVEGGKKILIISHSGFNYDDSKSFNVRVYEAEKDPQGKYKKIYVQKGKFKYSGGSSILDNIYARRGGTGGPGIADLMYHNIGEKLEDKTFAIKDIPEIPLPEPPEHMKKNLSKGWQPVTKEDEGMIKRLDTFFGTSVTGIKFAAQLALRLSKGDTTPITKSPGVGFDGNATRVIHSAIKVALQTNKTSYSNDTESWYDPKTGKGQVMDNAYADNNPIDNITRGALGKFTFKVTPKGIQVIDTYDISKVTSIGGLSNYITDFIAKLVTAGHGRGTGFTDQFGQSYNAQQTANLITSIAMRRGAELGFDMIDTDGKTIQPLYSMEDSYPDSQQLATPKGFNIPINYTMPTGITIKNLLNPRKYTQNKRGSGSTSKTVQTIKKMARSRSIGFDRDEPIVRRKKKRVDN